MLASINNSIISSTIFTQEVGDTDWVSYKSKLTGTSVNIIHPLSNSTSLTVVPYNVPVIGDKLIINYSSSACTAFTIQNPPSAVGGQLIEGASYGKNVGIQATSPFGVFFKPDGLKMFIIDNSSKYVYQYKLSIAWDTFTATYDKKSFSVGSQTTYPTDISFSTDGSKMFIVSDNNDTIFQYTLSTAWDVSTASYENISFVTTTQAANPYAVFFTSDGLSMYIANNNSNTTSRVYQYSLSSAWNVGTATYANKDAIIGNIASRPHGLFFNTSGTTMFIVNYTGGSGSAIYQYSVGTAWDVSTATYSTKSFTFGSQIAYSMGLFFKSDGSTMFTLNNPLSSYSTVWKFNFSTPWDVNTCQLFSKSYTIPYTSNESGSKFALSSDGSQFYMVIYDSNTSSTNIYQYLLSIPWDITTASYTFKSFTYVGTRNNGLTFNKSGTRMYMCSSSTVLQFDLATAWDISTATATSSTYGFAGYISNSNGVFFNPTGTIMYACNKNNISTNAVYQYNLSSAWDVSTASPAGKSVTIGSNAGNPYGFFFNNSGTSMYVIQYGNTTVCQYVLSSAWDVSTAAYTAGFMLNITGTVYPHDLGFSSDGTKMFVHHKTTSNSSMILQYNCDINTSYTFDITSLNLNYSPIGVYTPLEADTYVIVSPTEATCYSENKPISMVTSFTGTSIVFPASASSVVANQHILVTQRDLSSATYSNIQSTNFYSQAPIPYALNFNTDGTKMYVANYGAGGNNYVAQFNLSTPWMANTVTYATLFGTNSQAYYLNALQFSLDGTKMYIANNSGYQYVFQYTLSIAWDVSSAVYTGNSFYLAGSGPETAALFFSSDGKNMYWMEITGEIHQYTLSTAWDISTVGSQVHSFFASGQTGNYASGMFFNTTGTKFYVSKHSAATVYEYVMSTAWDISTAIYNNKSINVSSQVANFYGLYFNPDNSNLYALSRVSTTNYVYQYAVPVSNVLDRTILSLTESPAGTFSCTLDSTITSGANYLEVKSLSELSSTENFEFNQPSNLSHISFEVAKQGRYASLKVVGDAGTEVSSLELLLKKL